MPDNSGFGISGELASDDGERLQKVLARTGWGSRRECEILIEDGRVKVNDEIAVLGRRVKTATDKVEVDGVTIRGCPRSCLLSVEQACGCDYNGKRYARTPNRY